MSLRWVARFCVERRDATVSDASAAATAFGQMAEQPEQALKTLRHICSQQVSNEPDQATKPGN
jgi:hypothetical protein